MPPPFSIEQHTFYASAIFNRGGWGVGWHIALLFFGRPVPSRSNFSLTQWSRVGTSVSNEDNSKFTSEQGAQWLSCRVLDLGPRVRASSASLRCGP